MKHTAYLYLFCSLLCLRIHAQAQEPSSTGPDAVIGTGDVTVTVVPYEFKSKSLEGQVKEAIEEGGTPIYQLMDQYAKTPDKVLVLLKPYLKSSDFDVQSVLIDFASLAPQSDEALNILIHLVGSRNAGAEAARALYREYTSDQLLTRGGNQLKSALLRGAISNRNTTHAYLLLSLYKNDDDLKTFLQKRRATFADSTATSNPRLSRTMEKVSLDLALVELGDESALKRIQELFARNKPDELRALLQNLKFVHNKDILNGAVEQLKNKTVSRTVYVGATGVEEYFRVCDDAVFYLSSMFKLSTPGPLLELNHHYTDAELTAAYNKAQATLTATP